MSHRSTPNFCAECGAALGASDTYCSQCGTSVGATRSAGGSMGRSEFRRRVEDLTIEGWEIERDYGDRAVVIDRGFGSIGLHVLLLLFTSGIGNLLYAWYCYSPGADRVEVRADGTYWRLNENEGVDATTALSAFLALLLVCFGLAMIVSPLLGVTVFGVCALVAVGLVFPPVRRRLAQRRSVTTFGRARVTDERVVDQPHTPCSVCASPVNTGVERTYGTRSYIAGIPISAHEDGKNVYCRSCANGDAFGDHLHETESA